MDALGRRAQALSCRVSDEPSVESLCKSKCGDAQNSSRDRTLDLSGFHTNVSSNVSPPARISQSPVRRILGSPPALDPRFLHYSVAGNRLTYVTSGCIRSGERELPARIRVIVHDLADVIAAHLPTEVAGEKVFVSVKGQSTLLLGQARGAAICAAVLAELPVAEYTALQVKQAVVGHGKAAKEQVQDMVRRLLPFRYASPDAADALACAIAHAHTARRDSAGSRRPVSGCAAASSDGLAASRPALPR